MTAERLAPLLFRRIAAAHRPPWLSLVEQPSPLVPAPALGAALGVADLWLKDDGRSAPICGGSKPRKLEFLLGAARAARCPGVVSVGPVGSNHLLATAVHARRAGLRCHAYVFPRPIDAAVVETLRATLGAGASLAVLPHATAAAPLTAYRGLVQAGPDLFFGPGGSGAPGNLGFVEAALELAAQCEAQRLAPPAWVVVPLGSAGIAAGLAVGLQFAGLPTRVLAVRVVPRVAAHPLWVLGQVRATHAALSACGLDPGSVWAAFRRIVVHHGEAGPGYGSATPAAREAQALALALSGLRLDLTYAAKALAAVRALARPGPGAPAGPVVFWQTHNARPLDSLLTASPTPRELPLALRLWLGRLGVLVDGGNRWAPSTPSSQTAL